VDDIERRVQEAIREEQKIKTLVQEIVEWMQNTRVVEGQDLPSQAHKFVEETRKEFPEFIWRWNRQSSDESVVVNLMISDGEELPKEDYLNACMRVIVELDVNTHDISKARIEEFSAFAAHHGISVTFREVAELPREVIRRVHAKIFS